MALYYEYHNVTGFLIGTYESPPEPVRPDSTLVDYAPIPPIRARWTGFAWVDDPAQEAQQAADKALFDAQTWGITGTAGILRVLTAAGSLAVDETAVIANPASATYLLPVAPAVGSTLVVGAAGFATVGMAQATIDAGVGVVVAGHTRFIVLTYGTALLLRWNGVQWLGAIQRLESPWLDGGVITIGATTLAPTKGTTTRDKFYWRRVGQDLLVRYEFRQTTVGTSGTGNYLYTIPFTVDTALAFATTGAGVVDAFQNTVGDARYTNNAGNGFLVGSASLYDSTRFRISGSRAAAGDFAGSGIGMGAAQVAMSANIRVPIINW